MVRESGGVVEMRRALGERLAAHRKAAGLTQAQLASVVFCDRTRLAHLEKGRGSADERFWRAADEALRADGGLVRAELEFRAAQREQDNERRDVELAAIRDQIAEWSADHVVGDGRKAVRSVAVGTDLAAAMEWLDDSAGWVAGTARTKVRGWLRDGSRARLARDVLARGRVGRERLAADLSRYYADAELDTGVFVGTVGAQEVLTSILTRPSWTGLATQLVTERETMRLVTGDRNVVRLDERGQAAAVRRLAEAEFGKVRLADVPLYRLLSVDIGDNGISGSVGMASFVEYALTTDLLESELVDAIVSGRQVRPGALPLRDAQLPDRAAVLDISRRLCAGGVLALTAIARPADSHRGPADYAILIQRRSGHVLNADGRLAVIPKGFHGPLVDYRGDSRISATLLRELEEELFGRADVDTTVGQQRAAEPMHPSRLSAPMRWLAEVPGRMRLECTGFGLNLVSGNYEFAGLVVIEDEEFWARFGGAIEANWETSGLRQISTLDSELIVELVSDQAWTNEGLFALLQGLQRIGEIDGKRVDLPMIGWDVR